MGDTMSLAKDKHVPVRGFSVVCDECGTIFYVSHDILCGRDNKKRCTRSANSTKINFHSVIYYYVLQVLCNYGWGEDWKDWLFEEGIYWELHELAHLILFFSGPEFLVWHFNRRELHTYLFHTVCYLSVTVHCSSNYCWSAIVPWNELL